MYNDVAPILIIYYHRSTKVSKKRSKQPEASAAAAAHQLAQEEFRLQRWSSQDGRQSELSDSVTATTSELMMSDDVMTE
jgi:hypothetical protein